MNNPWPSLIAALSGERVRTPSTWPVREIHRLCDVCAAKSGDSRQARQSNRPRVPAFAAPGSRLEDLAAPAAPRWQATWAD